MTTAQILARIKTLETRLDHLVPGAPLRFGAAIRSEIRTLSALLPA